MKGITLTRVSPPSLAIEPRPWCLLVVGGPLLGAKVELADVAIVGREGKVDIKLDVPSVSRRHCHIYRKRGGYWVTDLGATNPTRVNDIQVSASPVLDGDMLTVGEVVLKMLSPTNPENDQTSNLEVLARKDPLTGLASRYELRKAMDTAFAESASGAEIGLIVIDVDHFKHINDRFGHAAGERVLTTIARVMRDQARPTDTPARIGGEEFAVLLPNTAKVDAMRMAERLRLSFAALQLLEDGEPVTVTATFGVAVGRATNSNPDHLYTRADSALYEAKRFYRNRVVTLPDP